MRLYHGGQSQSVTAPDGYPEVGIHAAKPRTKLSTKRRLTENERISSSPTPQSLADRQARQVARYDLTHSRYEGGPHESTQTKPAGNSWRRGSNAGGEGPSRNVASGWFVAAADRGHPERLPSLAAPSVLTDWLQSQAPNR